MATVTVQVIKIEADVLTLMITVYEDKHVRIEPADPFEVIKFVIDQKDLKQADLAPYMGGKTSVSEVLNRKRGLTKLTIINLNKAFDIPVEALMTRLN